MRYMSLFLLFILICSNVSLAENKYLPELKSIKEWEAKLEDASAKKTLIFIEFYSQFCGVCDEFYHGVLLDSNLKANISETFISLKVDIESTIGVELVERYGIENIPSSLLVNDKAAIVHFIKGYRTVDHMVNTVIEYKQIVEAYREIDWQVDPALLKDPKLAEYAIVLDRRGFSNAGKKYADAYFHGKTYFSLTDMEWLLIKAFYKDAGNPVLKQVVKNYDAFSFAIGKNELNRFLNNVFEYNLRNAIKYKDEDLLEKSIALIDVVEFYELKAPKSRLKQYYRVFYYEQAEIWESYFPEAISYFDHYDADDSEKRNAIMNFYLYCDNYQQVEIATSWAKNLARKTENFENLVTYAFMMHRMKKSKKVSKLLNKAEKYAENEDQKKVLKQIRAQLEG